MINTLEGDGETPVLVNGETANWQLVTNAEGNKRVVIERGDGTASSFDPEDGNLVDQIIDFLSR